MLRYREEEIAPRKASGARVKGPVKVTISEKRLNQVAFVHFEGKRKLVSVEIAYLKKRLGRTATEDQIHAEMTELARISWGEMVQRYEN